MYAVIEIGAAQFRVSEGDTIAVTRLNQSPGESVDLDKVLLYAKGSEIKIGQPYLKDVKVTAKVSGETLGKKTIAFKFRCRKNSAWRKGDRRKFSLLDIEKITAD
ncbi:MAG: 50S ribosomal protein L21 [Candidatus Omnitrophota bacterium]